MPTLAQRQAAMRARHGRACRCIRPGARPLGWGEVESHLAEARERLRIYLLWTLDEEDLDGLSAKVGRPVAWLRDFVGSGCPLY